MIYNLRRQKEDERDFKYVNLLTEEHLATPLPKKIDKRSQYPVPFDQGQLGSCSANAGCASLARLLKLKVILSRLDMYFQERALEGSINEDSGAQMRDICKVAVNGVCEESYFPYDINKFTETPSPAAEENAKLHKATSYHSVRTLTEIKQALAFHDYDVLIGMEVFESFESELVAKTGIVPMPKRNEQQLGGHAVLVVGYDDIRKCLIVRNSWGPDWGDHGYFYLPYDFVTKGLAFDFWVLS